MLNNNISEKEKSGKRISSNKTRIKTIVAVKGVNNG